MSEADVLAVADHRRGDLRESSYEVVSAGRAMTEATGGNLHVAVVGGDVEGFAERLNLPGVTTVHAVAEGAEYNHDVTALATAALFDSLDPGVVLAPNGVNGLDTVPAVAARLSVPLVTDVTAIEAEEEGLTLVREMYGSKVETTLTVERPAVVTVREGSWPVTEGTGDAAVVPFELDIDEGDVRSTVRGFEESGGDVDITDAEFVVAVGRGIEDEENLDLVWDLVDALDATLAASRPVVDQGWLPKSRQVGQSGATVSPSVYIALGISGAVQHLAGVEAGTVIAVNTDPDAPIFDVADYGVVDDLFDVVPELIARFGSSG